MLFKCDREEYCEGKMKRIFCIKIKRFWNLMVKSAKAFGFSVPIV